MAKSMTDAIPDLVSVNAAFKGATVKTFGAASSVNSGFLNVILTDPETRGRTQQQIADQLSGVVNGLTGARTFVQQQQTISTRRGGAPVEYVLQAPNFEKLTEVLPAFLEQAQQDPTFAFVDANLKFNKPELRLTINRDRARDLGVSALDIAQTLQLALSEARIGYFIMDGKQYQVIAQVTRENRNETLDLRSIYVRNASGQPVQLDASRYDMLVLGTETLRAYARSDKNGVPRLQLPGSPKSMSNCCGSLSAVFSGK